jgi:hypothetical protein
VVQACLDELRAAEHEDLRDPVRDAADHVRALLGSAR